jgi:NADH:ubiquinone oxidoreductase subunit 5 (subunit L)/multisubunit Na+/H+ antiporter MnhA subunit
MGGLAGKMPVTSASSIVAALSIAGSPPFACFWSEFLIFVGAFAIINDDPFYIYPTILMLIATVLSLAYSLRFVYRVFLAKPRVAKEAETATAEGKEKAEKKIIDVPNYMKAALIVLAVFVVVLGVYPAFFINLISGGLALI